MASNTSIKTRNILLWILFLNWAVAFAKVFYGYIAGINSMLADGFHSFSDGTSNIICLIGVFIASRPADKTHPYGHKKYETFASLGISVLLFLISFSLLKNAIFRFAHPVMPEVGIVSFVVMIFTTIVNLGVYFYENSKAKELKSDSLYADSEHTKSDILVSISVIFTLLAIKAGFPMVDAIVTFAIALLIAKSSVKILLRSSEVLCDRNVVVSDKIRALALSVEGVKQCHNIRTRGRSDDIYVDMHILVDTDMPVSEAHKISHEVEQTIRKNIDGINDVVIHVEPIKNRNTS